MKLTDEQKAALIEALDNTGVGGGLFCDTWEPLRRLGFSEYAGVPSRHILTPAGRLLAEALKEHRELGWEYTKTLRDLAVALTEIQRLKEWHDQSAADHVERESEVSRLGKELAEALSDAEVHKRRGDALDKVAAGRATELNQCREVLREIEWVFEHYEESSNGRYCCPSCGMSEREGHDPDCKLAKCIEG